MGEKASENFASRAWVAISECVDARIVLMLYLQCALVFLEDFGGATGVAGSWVSGIRPQGTGDRI